MRVCAERLETNPTLIRSQPLKINKFNSTDIVSCVFNTRGEDKIIKKIIMKNSNKVQIIMLPALMYILCYFAAAADADASAALSAFCIHMLSVFSRCYCCCCFSWKNKIKISK